ncbi:hypothetical protein [Paenibacillus larvae]
MPEFGHMKINEIKTLHLVKFFENLKKLYAITKICIHNFKKFFCKS